MPAQAFRWRGLDRERRPCSGELTASDIADARAQLLRRGIRPQRVQTQAARREGRVRGGELSVFLRQLATLIQAGLPLVPALEATARHAPPRLRPVLQTVRAQIESGSSFADSLAQCPRVFDELLVALIAAAERSGTLAAILQRLASDREKAERLRRKLLKALSYPLAVVLVALLVTAGLLRFAVPQFEELYRSFGGELPAYTRAVLGLARLARTWSLPLLVLLACAILLLRARLRRSAALRLRLNRAMLRLPLFGSLLRRAALSRYARTLSTLLAAGIPLADALSAAGEASGSAVYARAIAEVREQVIAGQPLHAAMQQHACFPPLAVQMLQIGEDSGALETMAARLADLDEDELDLQVETLSKLMEPLLMIVLGILVGGLVLAMYLPIFRLGQTL